MAGADRNGQRIHTGFLNKIRRFFWIRQHLIVAQDPLGTRRLLRQLPVSNCPDSPAHLLTDTPRAAAISTVRRVTSTLPFVA